MQSCGDCVYWDRGFFPRPDKPCNWKWRNAGPVPAGVPKTGEHQCKYRNEGWNCFGFDPYDVKDWVGKQKIPVAEVYRLKEKPQDSS